MVQQPYYEVETRSRYTSLADTIYEFGVRQSERTEAKFDTEASSYTEVVVDSWAHGPLLKLTKYDSSGDVIPPTLDTNICQAIVQAGYVPWGFRPNTVDHEETGEFLWYLRPLGEIRDENSSVYETEYAIKTPESEWKYLRGSEGGLVTFDKESVAEAVAGEVEDGAVVEIPK